MHTSKVRFTSGLRGYLLVDARFYTRSISAQRDCVGYWGLFLRFACVHIVQVVEIGFSLYKPI